MTAKNSQPVYCFTVATVVKNNVKGIRATIESIINQNFDSFEFIVIDGGSTDGTLEILQEYSEYMSFLSSSSDNGVYEAMNKSLDHASGDWIIFMNSGDAFASHNTLKKVYENTRKHANSIIYGDCLVKPRKSQQCGLRLVRALDPQNLSKGSCFSHQSTFIPVKYHKENKYDTNLRISADFKFFYLAFTKDKMEFHALEFPISILQPGGLSDKDQFQSVLEWSQVIKNKSLYLTFYYSMKLLIVALKQKIKEIVRYHGS